MIDELGPTKEMLLAGASALQACRLHQTSDEKMLAEVWRSMSEFVPAASLLLAMKEALAPFVAAAKMGVATYDAVRAANLRENGLSEYETVYVSAGTYAAESRVSYADWQRLAKIDATLNQGGGSDK